MSDLISRQAALEAIRHIEEVYINNLPTMIDKTSVQTELMMLPSAEEIVVWQNPKQHCEANMKGEDNE